jgi:hypothetical protein
MEDKVEEADAGLDERWRMERTAGPDPADRALWTRSANAATHKPAPARMLAEYCPDMHPSVELLEQNNAMF